MEEDRHPCDDCPLPEALRAAVSRGWEGLAILSAAPGRRVRLACAAPGGEVDALARAGLAIGLPPSERPTGRRSHPRRVVLAMVAGPRLAMTLDLGFADARALVGRLGADAGLELVWVRAEHGAATRTDVVGLSHDLAERLRAEAALQGEWRTDDPTPDGFSAAEWSREARSPGPARLARGGRRDARVVVVAPVGARIDGAADASDVRLGFPSGPPVPEAGPSIGLSFGDARQRHLATRLGDQDGVAILLLDEHGSWVAQVDLRLGPESRRLIAEAARRRASG